MRTAILYSPTDPAGEQGPPGHYTLGGDSQPGSALGILAVLSWVCPSSLPAMGIDMAQTLA